MIKDFLVCYFVRLDVKNVVHQISSIISVYLWLIKALKDVKIRSE